MNSGPYMNGGYIFDMSVLDGRITALEEKIDYIMDFISRYEVERLVNIKRKTEENKTDKTCYSVK